MCYNVKINKGDNMSIPTRRGGYYYINDKPYPSVTTVLNVIAKPFLFNWGMNEAAKAALADPTMDYKDAGAAVRAKTKLSANRGTYVHNVAEVWCKDGIVPEPHGEYSGYIQGLRSFILTHNPEPIAAEIEVYSDVHIYAGTADCICKINGITWLLDFKTNEHGNIYPEVALQLKAYKEAIQEMDIATIEKTGVVCCDIDGGFTFRETVSDLETFLHAKALWEWSKRKNVIL